MSSDSFKCSVCGGTMRMLTVVANKMGNSRRYKCTCGHIEDLQDDGRGRNQRNEEALNLDGFQELPEGFQEIP